MDENYKISDFSHLHWTGTFQDYLDLVTENPRITRNAFQRVHDMIMTYGMTNYTEYKKEVVRYHFFDDPIANGKELMFIL
jgi:serine protein kinase